MTPSGGLYEFKMNLLKVFLTKCVYKNEKDVKI